MLQPGQFGPLQARFAVLADRGTARGQQVRFGERFGQIVDGSALDGADRRRNVAVSGNEDDGGGLFVGGLFLEIRTVYVGKLDIQYEARRQVGSRRGYIFGG